LNELNQIFKLKGTNLMIIDYEALKVELVD